jgi:hypothetical protein
MGQWKNLVGMRFGFLTVVKYEGKSRWMCRCDCGTQSITGTGNLISSNTKSCGCRKKAVLGESTTKHGKANTRVYRIWKAMRSRCNNSNTPRYKDYGALGITICKRWDKFENFYADMGEPPPNHSIDRINHKKGYEPNNCKWATTEEQNMNRRNSISIDGVPLLYWAILMEVPYSTAYGWYNSPTTQTTYSLKGTT